ncbi:MAG TPA: bifunctional 5,10-methylenetetrahydrofolate dehydrogenase/5,10-methenyltetrahydrofolate cyclohydrolase [Candidatus Saccharimonadaceae bacterium]|nr:bifunctional 5,10-methylenetetrahydrofolate dehydrogenase/5,10-methenyltetrahydrofolate cyclohydrolase [Candidatus Saccharimonadaceae bacterium]
MTKLLNGKELAGFIKERQAKQVRALRQAHHIFPRLAIITTTDNPVIERYMALKQAYGADILIDVDIHHTTMAEIMPLIAHLNADETVHGIIIQLPLADENRTQECVDAVSPSKDVDGLGQNATLDPATPMAISWLLGGYNVELAGKKIALVGRGRLVGAPLERMWRNSGFDVTVITETSSQRVEDLIRYDVIVSATGVPRLITSAMVKSGAVLVDAGTASESGKIVGDLSPELYEREDLTITPQKGGVGPLTVTALFDNVIHAAGLGLS